MFVLQRTYGPLGVEVQPLRIREVDLNTKRMLDLMAVSHNDGPMPLYLHTVYRILRNMRTAQQETGIGFSYAEFKRQINDTTMTPAQPRIVALVPHFVHFDVDWSTFSMRPALRRNVFTCRLQFIGGDVAGQGSLERIEFRRCYHRMSAKQQRPCGRFCWRSGVSQRDKEKMD